MTASQAARLCLKQDQKPLDRLSSIKTEHAVPVKPRIEMSKVGKKENSIKSVRPSQSRRLTMSLRPASRTRLSQKIEGRKTSELTDSSVRGAVTANPQTDSRTAESESASDTSEAEARSKGKGKKPMTATPAAPPQDFLLHEGAVKDKSELFARMLDNTWLESRTRRIALEEIDVATFQLFAEFVHNGTYTDPGVKQKLDDNRKNLETSVPPFPRRNGRETRGRGRREYRRRLRGVSTLREGWKDEEQHTIPRLQS